MSIKEDKLCACVLNVMKTCTRTQIISLLKHYRIVIQLWWWWVLVWKIFQRDATQDINLLTGLDLLVLQLQFVAVRQIIKFWKTRQNVWEKKRQTSSRTANFLLYKISVLHIPLEFNTQHFLSCAWHRVILFTNLFLKR